MRRVIDGKYLTDEMNNAIDSIRLGEDIKVFAFAGSGKSTFLRAVEKYIPCKALYLVFNKSLEVEARRLFYGANITISTGHSLALKKMSSEDKAGFLSKNKDGLSRLRHIKAYDFLKYGNVKDGYLEDLFDIKSKTNLILETVNVFLSSASDELSEIHISSRCDNYIKNLIKNKKIRSDEVDDIKKMVIGYARSFVKEQLMPLSDCPITHDVYFKYFVMSKLDMGYDAIYLDEAQDSASVMLSLILNQSCTKVFVGDPYQSISQFRNSIDAMQIIPASKKIFSVSFRFAQGLADLATRILRHKDRDVSIIGKGSNVSIIRASSFKGVAEPMLYLTNKNDSLLDACFEAYISGVKFKIINGNKNKFTVMKLQSLISFYENGKPTYKEHMRFETVKHVSIESEDNMSRFLAKKVIEDPERARVLLDALNGEIESDDEGVDFYLSTAHGSKGLEYDHVMLGDDFDNTIQAFGSGNELSEQDLYLMYVAVTRARKTLVISDELYDALERDADFKVVSAKIPDFIYDNIPVNGSDKNSNLVNKINSELNASRNFLNTTESVDVVDVANTDQVQLDDENCANSENISTEKENQSSSVDVASDEEADLTDENISTEKENQSSSVEVVSDEKADLTDENISTEKENQSSSVEVVGDEKADLTDENISTEKENQSSSVEVVSDEKADLTDENISIKNINSTSEDNEVGDDLLIFPSSLSDENQIKILVGKRKGVGYQNKPINELPNLFWSINDTKKFLSPNLCIVGKSGSGKTQTTKAIISQLMFNKSCNTNGCKIGVLIFDLKADYVDKEFLKLNKVKLIKPSRITVNPFHLFDKSDEFAVFRCADVFTDTVCKAFRLGKLQSNSLRDCILKSYELKGIKAGKIRTYNKPPPSVNDVIKFYLKQDFRRDSLYSAIRELDDYKIFEPDTNKCESLHELLEDSCVVFDLSKGLSEPIQSLIIATIIDQFYFQMGMSGKPDNDGDLRPISRLILVDEAHSFINKNFGSFDLILRRGREYGAGFLLSTQKISDLITKDNNYASLMNAWILHSLANPRTDDVKTATGVQSKKSIDAIKSKLSNLKKHNAIFVCNQLEQPINYQISVTMWQYSNFRKSMNKEKDI